MLRGRGNDDLDGNTNITRVRSQLGGTMRQDLPGSLPCSWCGTFEVLGQEGLSGMPSCIVSLPAADEYEYKEST